MYHILLALAVGIQCFSYAYAVPCVFGTGSSSSLSLEEFQQCMDATPLNEAAKNQTINTVKVAVEEYSFIDFYNQPGPAFRSAVQLRDRLEAIRGRQHASDWAFHNDMRQLFCSLKDAHTVYRMPSCYNFDAVQVRNMHNVATMGAVGTKALCGAVH